MMYGEIVKNFLDEIIDEGFANGGLKFNLINDRPWDFELPEGMKLGGNIILDIKGWALEQSYITDDGLFIQTAFGDDEYSKEFTFDEIINIITFDGVVLYQKTMVLDDEPKESREKFLKEF